MSLVTEITIHLVSPDKSSPGLLNCQKTCWGFAFVLLLFSYLLKVRLNSSLTNGEQALYITDQSACEKAGSTKNGPSNANYFQND